MASFKIDLSTAAVIVATAPQPKIANRRTGEIATDPETGAQLMTVGLMVVDDGEANLLDKVTVLETGITGELTTGAPVGVTGLRAREWENVFNGEKRQGISFRAVAITPMVPAMANGQG